MPLGVHLLMLRPKDKPFEIAAALCGVAALIAYYGLGNDALMILCLIAGVAALAWAYFDVGR